MNEGGRAMPRPVALILQILKHASRMPCLPQASVVPLLAAAFFCGLSPESSVELVVASRAILHQVHSCKAPPLHTSSSKVLLLILEVLNDSCDLHVLEAPD